MRLVLETDGDAGAEHDVVLLQAGGRGAVVGVGNGGAEGEVGSHVDFDAGGGGDGVVVEVASVGVIDDGFVQDDTVGKLSLAVLFLMR
jgi:hypothetical protein